MNTIGFYTLIKRGVVRFLRIWRQTFLAPVVSAILFLVIFGMFIGKNVPEIQGLSYIEFIIPGLIMMSLINSAYSDTSFSLYLMRWERNIEEILTSPMSYLEMVFGFIISGALRGFLVGLTIYLFSLFFAITIIKHVVLLFIISIAISIIFSSLGIIIALYAKGFDSLNTWITFILNPLIFLGGVFHTTQDAAPLLKSITLVNPIFYMVDAFRFSMFGFSDGNLIISAIVIIALSVVSVSFCLYLFKKGHNLRW